MKNKLYIICLAIILAAIGYGLFFYFNSKKVIIRDFIEEKDFVPLVKLMNNDLFLLSENRDFSPERVLLRKSPDYEKTPNLATITVAEVDKQTAGFVAYVKKGPSYTYIWLLGVDKNFRRQGLGKKLLYQAFKDLTAKGYKSVTIAVRSMNKPALLLYKSVGFVEESNDKDRGMIILRKGLNTL